MSSSDASLTEAQWDLLADYLGGALDGDPRHAEVTALIDSDPGWRQAHTLLADATDAVLDDLRVLAGAPVGPMPDDVAARLDEALRGGEVAPVVPLRRRMPRWAVPATIAAGVLAFAGVGLTGLIVAGDDAGENTATSAGRGAPEAASAPMLAQRVVFSGRDYTPVTAVSLAELVDERDVTGTEELSSPLAASSGHDAPAPARDDAGRVPPVLARLTDRAALQACLRAIAAEQGAATVAAQLIDYASFEGSPALLVLFTDPAGRDMVWVTGPECGTAGMGADTRYHAPVG